MEGEGTKDEEIAGGQKEGRERRAGKGGKGRRVEGCPDGWKEGGLVLPLRNNP